MIHRKQVSVRAFLLRFKKDSKQVSFNVFFISYKHDFYLSYLFLHNNIQQTYIDKKYGRCNLWLRVLMQYIE